MPDPVNLTPEQRSLTNKANAHQKSYNKNGEALEKRAKSASMTEADITAMENYLKAVQEAKRNIDECYLELCLQLPDRAAEYQAKVDTLESSYSNYVNLCSNRTEEIRDSIAQAVQDRIDQLEREQKLRLAVAAAQSAPAPTAAAGNATGTPVRPAQMKPISDLKPNKLNRNASPLELNNWIRAYTAYATASNFSVTNHDVQRGFVYSCLEDDLQEFVSSKVSANTPVFGDNGVIDIIQKRFEVKYPLFTKRLQYFKYEQGKGQSFSEFRAQLQKLHEEANIKDLGPDEILSFRVFCGISDAKLREKLIELEDPSIDDIDAEALKYETNRSTLNACKGGTASANTTDSRSGGRNQQYTPQNPGSIQGLCRNCGRTPHQGNERCPAHDKICSECKKTGHYARGPKGIILCMTLRNSRGQKGGGGRGRGGGRGGRGGGRGKGRGGGQRGGGNSQARTAEGGNEGNNNSNNGNSGGNSGQSNNQTSTNQVECYFIEGQFDDAEPQSAHGNEARSQENATRPAAEARPDQDAARPAAEARPDQDEAHIFQISLYGDNIPTPRLPVTVRTGGVTVSGHAIPDSGATHHLEEVRGPHEREG